MKLTRVIFTELCEVEGAFGRERIGMFPKYLTYSYDLDTNTVILPFGWSLSKTERGIMFEFNFGDYHRIVLPRDLVKKVDIIEVADYNPREFQPHFELALMTLRVLLGNKNRTDELIQRHRMAKTVIAVRSRESSMTDKGVKYPQCLYELVMQKSIWRDFAKQLYDQNLVSESEKERFAILVDYFVFPRQLAYFKDSK